MVGVGLVEHIPLVDELARGAHDIGDVRERAAGDFPLPRRAPQRLDRSRQVPPARPDQHMPAHVQPVIPHPPQPCQRLRLRETGTPLAGPRRPLQIVLRARGIEQLEDFLPVDAVVRRVVHDPRHLQRRTEMKRRRALLHPYRCPRHRPPGRIHHRHREIALADRLDARKRRRPPRRARLPPEVGRTRLRQRRDRHALPIVHAIEAAELDRLPLETKTKHHLARVRRVIRPKRERHEKLLPLARQHRMRALEALGVVGRRLLHHPPRRRRTRLITRRHRPRHKPHQPHVALRHRPIHRRPSPPPNSPPPGTRSPTAATHPPASRSATPACNRVPLRPPASRGRCCRSAATRSAAASRSTAAPPDSPSGTGRSPAGRTPRRPTTAGNRTFSCRPSHPLPPPRTSRSRVTPRRPAPRPPWWPPPGSPG